MLGSKDVKWDFEVGEVFNIPRNLDSEGMMESCSNVSNLSCHQRNCTGVVVLYTRQLHLHIQFLSFSIIFFKILMT